MGLLKKIEEQVKSVLDELPDNVKLVAAVKTRSAEEINAAIKAGISIIGENYVQEAVDVRPFIEKRVSWHFIGHLQKNKVKKAVEIFDLIETVDSVELAFEINKRCKALDKVIPVLVEVNSGREESKQGIAPDKVEFLVKEISRYKYIKVKGLMTMGPFSGDPEAARPYFRETRSIFDALKDIPEIDMEFLSMGMTNSYKIALEEGANIIRIGTKIFGDRN